MIDQSNQHLIDQSLFDPELIDQPAADQFVFDLSQNIQSEEEDNNYSVR